MRVRYYLRLVKRAAALSIAHLREFPVDFQVYLTASTFYMIVTLAFWAVIFSHAPRIAGWGFGDVVVLQAFITAGFLFWDLFLAFLDELDETIVSGELNLALVRPCSPLAFLAFRGMDFVALVTVPKVLFLLAVGGWLGARVSLPGVLLGLTLTVVGVLIVSSIVLALQSLSFWLGRTNLLSLFYNIYFSVHDYPIRLFSEEFRFVLTTLIPVAFFSTGPALVSLDAFSPAELGILFGGALLVLGAWAALAWLVWKAGLRRYEAHGG